MKRAAHRGAALTLRLETLLAPVVIVIAVMIAVLIATVVVVPVLYFVAVPVILVAISVTIMDSRVVSAAAIIGVMVVSIVPYDALIVAEARVISEARLILASPFPIFPLALTAEPVVLDIVISAFSQPLPVIRIVVSVIVARAVIRVVSPIPVLSASGGHDCPQSQS